MEIKREKRKFIANTGCFEPGTGRMDGPPKVRNLELSLHVQQQVFGLDVSVYNTSFVNVLYCI